MKNRIKGIRAIILAILLLILLGAVSNTVIKNIEAIKIRNLFDQSGYSINRVNGIFA